MRILKEKKLPYGVSVYYTRANAEVIGSEDFFDQMVDMGAKFAWFFTFQIKLSPFFVAVVAFCFSMTVGVMWYCK